MNESEDARALSRKNTLCGLATADFGDHDHRPKTLRISDFSPPALQPSTC